MNIKSFEIEKIKDPTGILVGDRYECVLHLDIEEEDELFSSNGVYLKAIVAVHEGETKIASYHLYEDITNKYLDFELEEEEIEAVLTFILEKI